jgi:ribosomal protein L27
MGRDFTLYSLVSGQVFFERQVKNRQRVSVHPIVAAEAAS